MKPSSVTAVLACVAGAVAHSEPAAQHVAQLVEGITADVLASLDAREAALRRAGKPPPRCTSRNVVFRREYGALSEDERLEYVRAVLCLQQLPAWTPPSVAPGARSRFDDFVAVHIGKALTIHFTGNFQPWHRWFVHSYEAALRDECGYRGAQPYWDWPKYASAPERSPLFNGAPSSLGGNGESVPHGDLVLTLPGGSDGRPSGTLRAPAGRGGGFVTAGPFANMTVNLGPVGGVAGLPPGPQGGLGWNPRRLRRDLGPLLISRYANYTTVLDLLRKPCVDDFRELSESAHDDGSMGPHAAAHLTIAGDLGSDVFASAGDPAFFLHHTMLDRVWALWQALDPQTRRFALGSGPFAHITWANAPPSRLASLDDELDVGYAAAAARIRDAMDTLSGPLCYFYLQAISW